MASKAKSGGKKKDKVIIMSLQCTACKEINYVSRKNRVNHPDRIELNKYCKTCKTAVNHKETK